ncbi:MAG: diacylglycerol acyltransferase type 2 [Trebouxia sp. A1-2]|nr:MAG: diacylglycerol acyltransferase type 2 [Trebouxia sp. A1-2]
MQVAIVVLPVGEAPVLIQRAIHFSVQSALSYFSCRVTVEDADALKPGQAYVVGLEPHSALPVALPMVFTDHCDLLPKGLRGIKILAHTAVNFLNFVLSTLEVGFFKSYLSPQNPIAVDMLPRPLTLAIAVVIPGVIFGRLTAKTEINTEDAQGYLAQGRETFFMMNDRMNG